METGIRFANNMEKRSRKSISPVFMWMMMGYDMPRVSLKMICTARFGLFYLNVFTSIGLCLHTVRRGWYWNPTGGQHKTNCVDARCRLPLQAEHSWRRVAWSTTLIRNAATDRLPPINAIRSIRDILIANYRRCYKTARHRGKGNIQ